MTSDRIARRIRAFVKWLIFPGIDVHTRCRYRFLPRFFLPGSLSTLDAGFGNGALSYAAYKSGNHVVGVTISAEEVEKANDFFGHMGLLGHRLRFDLLNLYDLPKIDARFDQIICSETLEHILDDAKVVRHFHAALTERGVLHLCCPNSRHPMHAQGRVGIPEDGRHVRDGYTVDTYRDLLAPAGFEIHDVVGLGGPVLVRIDTIIRWFRNRWSWFGTGMAFVAFLLSWPLQKLDRLDPAVPHSLYVRAVRSTE